MTQKTENPIIGCHRHWCNHYDSTQDDGGNCMAHPPTMENFMKVNTCDQAIRVEKAFPVFFTPPKHSYNPAASPLTPGQPCYYYDPPSRKCYKDQDEHGPAICDHIMDQYKCTEGRERDGVIPIRDERINSNLKISAAIRVCSETTGEQSSFILNLDLGTCWNCGAAGAAVTKYPCIGQNEARALCNSCLCRIMETFGIPGILGGVKP